MHAADLEHVPCYFCGASDGRLWGEEAGYQALKCAACGLVYVSPRPRQDHIDEAARTGQHATERDALEVTGRYRKSRAREQERLVRDMFGDLRSGGRQPSAASDWTRRRSPSCLLDRSTSSPP